MKDKPNTKRIIMDRVKTRVYASNLGRSFDIKDDEGREEFTDWLLEIVDTLGMGLYEKVPGPGGDLIEGEEEE